MPVEKGPIERFLDLLNDDVALKAQFLADPEAVIARSGIEFDPETRDLLVGRDPERVRAALQAERGMSIGEDDHMYDIWVPQATIEWADSEGKRLDPATYRTGLAFVNLYGWGPRTWVAVQVDERDVGAARIGRSGYTPFSRPFPFQWPSAAYTDGDHRVGAYVMGDNDVRAESITVTVTTAGEPREV